jgi:hypothetical protein
VLFERKYKKKNDKRKESIKEIIKNFEFLHIQLPQRVQGV